MRKYIYYFIMAFIFISGFVVGACWEKSKPKWDIYDDERGCIIRWDDGTYSYKSPTIYLGDLEPGEIAELKANGIDVK